MYMIFFCSDPKWIKRYSYSADIRSSSLSFFSPNLLSQYKKLQSLIQSSHSCVCKICYLLLYFVILNFKYHQVLVEFNQISSCHLPLLVFELGMKFIQQFWWLGLWFKKMVGIFYAKKMHLSPCFWKSQSSPSFSKLINNKSFPHKFSVCFYFLSNDSAKHNYKFKIWKERFKVKDLIMNRDRDAGAKLKSLVKKLRLNYFFPSRSTKSSRCPKKKKKGGCIKRRSLSLVAENNYKSEHFFQGF